MATWLRLTLVTMTVGGGFVGLVFTAQALTNPGAMRPQALLLVAGFAGLYAFVLVAGLLFVHNPRRVLPVVVAVTAQLPWVSSPLLAYRFTAGAHVTVGMIAGRVVVTTRLGSDFQFNLLQPVPVGGGINLVALLLLAFLIRGQSRPVTPSAPPPLPGQVL